MRIGSRTMGRKTKGSAATASRIVRVLYVDDTEDLVNTEVDKTLHDVFCKACQIKKLEETELLGLARIINGVPVFMDLDTKTSKIAPKEWKTSIEGRGSDGKPLVTVLLMVQFYVEKPTSLRDSQLRTYYCHQLRRNFISYPFMYPDDRCFLLACYLILSQQTYSSEDSKSLDPRRLFPAWVLDKHGHKFVKHHLPQLTSDFYELSQLEAETLALSAMSTESPIPYGRCLQCCHSYLGLAFTGLFVYEIGDNGFVESRSSFLWKEVINVTVNKKKLQIFGTEQTSTLYMDSEELTDNVLKLIKNTHIRYTRTAEAGRSSTTSREQHRPQLKVKLSKQHSVTTPIYEDTTSSDEQSLNRLHPRAPFMKSHSTQNRHSIISNSSSTTSGIVSDKPCLSYYGSHDDLLGNCKTIASSGSQDSLLEPVSNPKSRPVQRAISEPSKKFEHSKTSRKNVYAYQPVIARAASDNTVRAAYNNRPDDPIYENIENVRSRLLAAAKVKPSKLSPRVSQDVEFLMNVTSLAYSKHKLMVLSQSALNRSLGQLNQAGHLSTQTRPGFASQQNLTQPSPSMEQLLDNYAPPPSYSERHERQRQQMLEQYRRHNETTPNYNQVGHNLASPTETERKLNVAECRCRAASSSELDRIKDNQDLPLISSLCNDKDLNMKQSPAHTCTQCSSVTNRYTLSHSLQSRPMSWHSESFTVPHLMPAISQPLEGY